MLVEVSATARGKRMLERLKNAVYEENVRLFRSGLAVLTWGNVSGLDEETGLVVIKPSGVDYDSMKSGDMVVVSLDGDVVEGKLRPSSDTRTHIQIYRNLKGVKGIAHTHSVEAVAYAQSGRDIPCYGTTHADLFYGPIPCTRLLSEEEVSKDYEENIGKVIVETLHSRDAVACPGVLVAGHGPFTWGGSVKSAVDAAIALEAVARMARLTEQIKPDAAPIPDYVAKKHYFRKHGDGAYYGQRLGNRV